MKRKILFTLAVHGDEGFSISVVERLKKEFPHLVEFVIGNPKALKQGVRYTDIDLNRVFPGDSSSKLYEYQRAAWLVENYIGKKDQYVHLDIHGTKADCGIFTIVTNPTPTNLSLAFVLPIENTVIWEGKYYKENDGFGAISEFSDCGVAIECGLTTGKTAEQVRPVQEKLYSILLGFITSYLAGVQIGNSPAKNIWQVNGKLMAGDGVEGLKDFQLVELGGKTFAPLLAYQYVKQGICCYTMSPLSVKNTSLMLIK